MITRQLANGCKLAVVACENGLYTHAHSCSHETVVFMESLNGSSSSKRVSDHSCSVNIQTSLELIKVELVSSLQQVANTSTTVQMVQNSQCLLNIKGSLLNLP